MKPATRDLLVAGPFALVLAARGAVAIASGRAWSENRHGPSHLMLGDQARLYGLGYVGLALLVVAAWLAFSLRHRPGGGAVLVLGVVLALAGFGGALFHSA